MAVTIIEKMNSFLKALGFEKKNKTFFKKLKEEYLVVIELSKEKNYTIIEGNLHTTTRLDYYDIYVSVYHQIDIKAFSLTIKDMGSFYPLTAIADIGEGVWLENNPNLETSMKNEFIRCIYQPLFIESRIFEFIYNLDIKRFGKHRYDSGSLLMASYDEKNYEVTRKCLHTDLVILYDPDCRENMSVYDALSVDDLINNIDRRDDLGTAERYLFEVYKKLYFSVKDF